MFKGIDTTHIPLLPEDTSGIEQGQRLQHMQQRMQHGGRNAPTMEEFMQAQMQVQAQIVNNENNIAQKLDQSRAILERAKMVQKNLENSPMPSGLPR